MAIMFHVLQGHIMARTQDKGVHVTADYEDMNREDTGQILDLLVSMLLNYIKNDRQKEQENEGSRLRQDLNG